MWQLCLHSRWREQGGGGLCSLPLGSTGSKVFDLEPDPELQFLMTAPALAPGSNLIMALPAPAPAPQHRLNHLQKSAYDPELIFKGSR